jgi:hypothetical protein
MDQAHHRAADGARQADLRHTVRLDPVRQRAGFERSVFKSFEAQAAQGGPITITHPDITRYFMTIEEASRLTIHAGAIGEPGERAHHPLIGTGAAPDTVVPVSTFTFIAPVNAVRYIGATPLLVDSERSTWNMDTERLQAHVSGLANDGKLLPHPPGHQGRPHFWDPGPHGADTRSSRSIRHSDRRGCGQSAPCY